MSEQKVFKCDVCGVEKKDGDQWFRAICGLLAAGADCSPVILVPWEPMRARFTGFDVDLEFVPHLHFCGLAHAFQWIKQVTKG